MNIQALTNQTEITKQIFKAKPPRKDGLLIQIQHTVNANQKLKTIRFFHASFDNTGHILAAGNHSGNILFLDFIQNKYWILPSRNSCTVLKFSKYNSIDVLVGMSSGNVCILNSETGETKGELISHNQPVTEISFSHDYMCLTSSRSQAIVWDLRSNSKIQILNVEPHCDLKHVFFMPISSNILGCFEDDTILVWNYHTFEIFKQIQPASWNKQPLKSIAFTRNGRAMVFSGYSPHLTIFMLDTWTVDNVIRLPNCINAVKKIDFIPQLFDGGCNRVLAILSSHGVLYFYNMEQNVIINSITVEEEITKFVCSNDGKHIACILKSGEINVYGISQYVPSYSNLDVTKQKKDKSLNTVRNSTISKNLSLLSVIQKQINEVLDVDKLHAILREFGEYPDLYRHTIWTRLLELPNNSQQYNVYINHLSRASFEALEKDYPLENKLSIKNLRKLLSNLVTWSPFFSQVTYLPVFVFPFVKVFQNEPVICFEALCTLIVNWCQHWFEYFPLPPVNILAMLENLLLEHDPDLLKHLTTINITSKMYAWPLLEAAFSEVLLRTDWCKLWDHIFSNEPAFLLMCVTAYNILQRHALFAMSSQSEFEIFYHNQNVIDIKRLISKSYMLLNSTSKENHPRQYLTPFNKLETGSYPQFLGFPKILIDFESNELDNLRKEQELIKRDEEQLLKVRRREEEHMTIVRQQEVEDNRLKELEKVCRERIHQEREHVKEQRKRLIDLYRKLHEEEIDTLNKSRQNIIEKGIKDKQRTLEKILSEVEQSRAAEDLEVIKAESEVVKRYSELLFHKIHLEKALSSNQSEPQPAIDHQLLKYQQQKLSEELEKIRNESKFDVQLKHLNIAYGITALDNLIMRIEVELARQNRGPYGDDVLKEQSSTKVFKLEAETKELEGEVSKLLHLLADLKSQESRERLSELHGSVSYKKDVERPQRHHQPHDFKDDVSNISAFGSHFNKLKKLIHKARDGYAARPSSPTNGSEESIVSEEVAVINLTHL